MTMKEYLDYFPIKEEVSLEVLSLSTFEEYVTELDSRIKLRRIDEKDSSPKLNIWKACRIGKSELVNCDILRWILDPTGNHSQQGDFAKFFFKEIGLNDPDFLKNFDHHYEVRTEDYDTDSGRVDVVLRSASFIVLIEVKIDASEGVDQVKRYWDRLNNICRVLDFNSNQRYLIYITKDGRSDKSGIPCVKCVSWETISNCFNMYSKSIGGNIVLSSMLKQYAEFITENIL